MIWNVVVSQQFTNYNIKDGLPSNHIYRITQDSQGFIWIITDNGIVKYNGKDFKVFNTSHGLPTNDIWGVQVTPDNNVWFFSKAKRIGYIKNDSVCAFPRENSNEIIFPASYYQYNNDFILLYNHDRVYLNDNSKWDRIDLTNENYNDTSQLKKRLIEDFKKDLVLRSFYIESIELKFDNYRDIVVDRKIYWYHDKGYGVYDMENNISFEREFDLNRKDEATNFTRFHFVNNEIQITGADYVAKLDHEYRMTSKIEIPEELQSHFSMIDRSGNIWLATNNNGIYKLPSSKRSSQYHLNNEIIQSVDRIGNEIIISVFDKGFYKYDEAHEKFEQFIPRKGFVYRAVQIEQLDHVYYIFGNLVEIRSLSSNQLINKINSNNWARRVVYFDGFLYGNISSGINKIDPETFDVKETYSMAGINDMAVFDDQLVIATSNGLKILKEDTFSDVTFLNNSMDYPVTKLEKINETNLLVSTNGFGAYFTNLSELWMLEGTEYLSINDVSVNSNEIILGTNNGILFYENTDSVYKLKKKVDDKHGLSIKAVSSFEVFGDDLIVGTYNGLSIVPLDNSEQEQLLDIYISEVRHNNRINKKEFSQPFLKGNTTTFSVKGIDFSDGNSQLDYEYRLMPLQKNWTVTSSESISFSDLGPDNYTLEIRAENNNASMDFEITPLWWQTNFSKAIFVLISLSIILLILLLLRKYELSRKMRHLQTQKKITEFKLYALRSQMNPHFVFNSLAAIQYYINNNEIETSEKYLVKFSKLIRQFFELSKEKEISLEKEIELLKNYLDIEKFRFKDRMEFEIDVDEKINTEKTMIPTMLLQPIVENAVNHGIFNKEKPGMVSLKIKYLTNSEVEIMIMDDGVGIENTKKKLNGKINSSNVLNDRIFHLNRSGNWDIEYSIKEAHPNRTDKGTIATFTIKNLS
jgi:hypothetical protein